MKKTVLDNYVVLYSENKKENFLDYLKEINLQEHVSPPWAFSSFTNINNTNHVNNQKVLTLTTADNIFYFINNLVSLKEQMRLKKNNLKYKLNEYAFTFLFDYIKEYELSIKKIKKWSIYEQISETDFHDDKSKDGLRHSYTILICLDSEYSGGEIIFKDRVGNEKISMSQGDVLIYPSGPEYMHKELEVTAGNKYVAIAHF